MLYIIHRSGEDMILSIIHSCRECWSTDVFQFCRTFVVIPVSIGIEVNTMFASVVVLKWSKGGDEIEILESWQIFDKVEFN